MFQYLSAGLAAILISGWIYYNIEVSSLKVDIATHITTIASYKAAIETKDLAISVATNSNTENSNTIVMLQGDLARLITSCAASSKLHNTEVQRLKKLIASLETDVQISGIIAIPSCKIKIQEVHDEVDYIGKSISNIGF